MNAARAALILGIVTAIALLTAITAHAGVLALAPQIHYFG